MLYCIVRFSSTTFALVPLITGRQLVELCVFLATCHIVFKYVYLLANKVIVWPDALVSQTAYLSIAYLSLYLYCLSTGAQRFYDDIRIMVGHQPSAWWNISLRYLTPVILLVSSSWLRARKKTRYRPGIGETICPRRRQLDGGIAFRRQSGHRGTKNRGGTTSVRGRVRTSLVAVAS